MSHQANFLGQHREAEALARAALTGVQPTPLHVAHFHAMQARALAAMNDASGTEGVLSRALAAFDRHRPDGEPPWLAYFDAGEMAAELAHCYRDLGHGELASRHAQDSLARAADASPRSTSGTPPGRW